MSEVDTLHEAETTAREIEAYRLAIKKRGTHILMYPSFFNAISLHLILYILFTTDANPLLRKSLC